MATSTLWVYESTHMNCMFYILLEVGAYRNIFEFDTSTLVWDYNWCVVLIKVALMTRYVATSVLLSPLLIVT